MSIALRTETSMTAAFQVLPFIATLDRFYPDVSYWYVNQVVPGLMTGNDKLLIARDGEHIAGVALGKLTLDETKLRCVRVHPDYQNNGLGIRLIDEMLDLLEDDTPKVTVSEELIHHYSRIFINRYNFKLNHVSKGQYRSGKLEYLFN
jgi:GNAT superfamily N-acetyltransferase